MNFVGSVAHSIAGAPLTQRLLGTAPTGLTCVLYHGFFFSGESKHVARERLRRQLQWLSTEYIALTMNEYHQAVASGTLPHKALLVTADDAKVDLLEVSDEFKAFGIPLTVFVCAGWTAQASDIEADGMLARAIATLEWYAGPETTLPIGNEARQLRVGNSCKGDTIDQVLSAPGYFERHLDELLAGIDKAARLARTKSTICSWSELASLRDSGVGFGSHSVSHIRLAPASDVRLRFEISEATRLIESKLGPCNSFAYPYGTPGTSDQSNDC